MNLETDINDIKAKINRIALIPNTYTIVSTCANNNIYFHN